MEKISVGIPTYNRPEGLSRTIEQITGQSYENLEIIISDNASTDPKVRVLLDTWIAKDPRVRVIFQTENIGMINNFIEVLSCSTSDYFMWAADDDEWHPDFIKTCYDALVSNNVGSVMTGFEISFRSLNTREAQPLPKLGGVDRFQDVILFFSAMTHGMIYGLHRKDTIIYLLDARREKSLCDDEYILIRQILNHGFLTLHNLNLYTAGMDEYPYKPKLPNEADGHLILYYKRYIHFINLIAENKTLTDEQKILVLQKYVIWKLSTLLLFEQDIRSPEQYELARLIYLLISKLDLTKIGAYIQLLDSVNSLK